MTTLIQNGTIITGDGKTVIKDSSMLIENGRIAKILGQAYPPYSRADIVIDANKGYIIPGFINYHSHGVTTGPFCPLGATPLTLRRVINNLDRHLLHGTTTVMNEDGIATLSEVRFINKLHPVKVETATQHTEMGLKHAIMGDGAGIREDHKAVTFETMYKMGVPAIGEVLALGPHYNIKRLEDALGTAVDIDVMTELKEVVLGTGMDQSVYDADAMQKLLERSGLDKYASAEEMKALIIEYVYDPWRVGTDALFESVDYALKYDIPVVGHNSRETWREMLEAGKKAGDKLIAVHSSYTFTPEHAVEIAKKLKEYGCYVDVFVGDYFGARQMSPDLDAFRALFKEDLVDLISTDYCAGHWDPIIVMLEMIVKEGLMSLERAVALATGNVVKAIPKLAYNSGLLEENKNADIVIVDKDALSKVEYVLVDGIVCVEKGRRVYRQM